MEELDAARQLLVSVARPDPARNSDVKVVLDRIRQLSARNPATNIHRGDTVELAGDEVEFKSRLGDKTLGKLPQGQQLEVLGSLSDAVVRAEVDGKKQRGLVKLTDVKRVKAANRPILDSPRCVRRKKQSQGSVRQGGSQRW